MVLDAAVEPGGSAAPPGTLVAAAATVATGLDALRLVRVQPESRGPMAAEDWIRGVRPTVGERLGSE
jgi:methionyl-tRNA formyltransferase